MKKTFIVALAMLASVMCANADGNIVSTARVIFSAAPVGAVNGNAKFSVSATKQVYFSKGNLQYVPATGEWKFASKQYTSIGYTTTNRTPSSSKTDSMDLFQFGHSGCTYGGKTYFPYNYTSSNYFNLSKNIQFTNLDWGVYNHISNGGDAQGHWRTLSQTEWNYLLNSRTQIDGGFPRYAWGRISKSGNVEVKGLILFPDVWNRPSGVAVTYGITSQAYTDNRFTEAQWELLEAAGAVFMPVTGWRNDGGTIYDYPGNGNYETGLYWTSTTVDASYSYALWFNPQRDMYNTSTYLSVKTSAYYSYSNNTTFYHYYGYAVRLVQDVPVAQP